MILWPGRKTEAGCLLDGPLFGSVFHLSPDVFPSSMGSDARVDALYHRMKKRRTCGTLWLVDA